MKLIGVPVFGVRALTPAVLSRFCVKFTLAFFIAAVSSSSFAQTNTESTHDSHSGMDAGENHSHAQGATHEHNVEHMLELLGVPEQVDKAAAEVLKLYSAKVAPDNTDENVKAIFDAYQQDATRIVYGVLRWDSLKPNYINSYASRMSEQDVAAFTDFLTSPVGQRYLASQTGAGLEIQQITKHLMEADMAEPLKSLGQELRDGLARLRAKQSTSN